MRINARILTALAMLVLLGAVWVLTQERDFSNVQIRTEKISDGIYMLEGSGGNIGVSAGEDGVFLIDDQYAPLTDKIRNAVAAISDKPIRFLINTHWHGDHTGGNENFGKAGVLIVAHENVRKRMSVDQFIEAFGSRTPAAPKAALPVVTFADSINFHLNGEEIRVFHVPPAHTDGDAIIHFSKSNVFHGGDTVFNGMYPFIDASSGGSIDGMIASADRLIELSNDASKIIPGHGPLGNRAQLTEFRNMLAGVRDRIAPLVKSGKSLKEVQAARPTRDFDEQWGKGFLNGERFTEIVFTLLSRTRR